MQNPKQNILIFEHWNLKFRYCLEFRIFAENYKIFNFDKFSSILPYGTLGKNLISFHLKDFWERLVFS